MPMSKSGSMANSATLAKGNACNHCRLLSITVTTATATATNSNPHNSYYYSCCCCC